MSVSLTLEWPAENATPAESRQPARYPKPTGTEGPFYTAHPSVVARGRELDALVDGARRLVAVDPAWALWALECAVEIEFLTGTTDELGAALRSVADGIDALYLAPRRVAAPYRPPRIDRRRLDIALEAIGHRAKPGFRHRLASAYDAARVEEVL